MSGTVVCVSRGEASTYSVHGEVSQISQKTAVECLECGGEVRSTAGMRKKLGAAVEPGRVSRRATTNGGKDDDGED